MMRPRKEYEYRNFYDEIHSQNWQRVHLVQVSLNAGINQRCTPAIAAVDFRPGEPRDREASRELRSLGMRRSAEANRLDRLGSYI